MVKIRQERLTYEDTLDCQKTLIRYIEKKIQVKPYFDDGDEGEKAEYFELLSRSLLGQKGPRIYITVNGVSIPVGSSVHHFGLNMLNVTTEKTKLIWQGREYIIESRKLWEKLLQSLLELFPDALREALHMSRELTREKKLSGVVYKSDEKIK